MQASEAGQEQTPGEAHSVSQARLLLPAAPSLPDSAPTLTLEEQKPQLAAGGLEETSSP